VIVEKLKRLLLILAVIGPILTIHEYGHLTEMIKRDIPVEEFSIGIGPALYQNTQGDFILSIRAFPVMAYVLPTKEGAQKMLEKHSFWERFIIYSAGIRNNLISGIIVIFFLQFLGWRKGIYPFSKIKENILYLPLKIFALFSIFVLEIITSRYIQTDKKFRFSSGNIDPPQIVKNFILLSLVIGFANFLPLSPLDGGKIFTEILSVFLSVSLVNMISNISLFLIIYVFIFARPSLQFMIYREMNDSV